jgi:glutamine amidotransferase-like uncharacterized protein
VNGNFGRIASVVLVIGLFSTPSFASSADSSSSGFRPHIYVYSGPGACHEGCVRAVSTLGRRNGFSVIHVKAADISGVAATFHPRIGDLWIQPGGNAITAAEAMTPAGLNRLRNWIGGGLNYLGLCAGVFLADSTVDDAETLRGLGLIPFSTADFYPGRHESMILPIHWGGLLRWLYFEDGATFRGPLPAGVRTIGTYHDGRVAVLQTSYGLGHVVLSGVHPEAPASWAKSEGLDDPDGQDTDLADELLWRALGLRRAR